MYVCDLNAGSIALSLFHSYFFVFAFFVTLFHCFIPPPSLETFTFCRYSSVPPYFCCLDYISYGLFHRRERFTTRPPLVCSLSVPSSTHRTAEHSNNNDNSNNCSYIKLYAQSHIMLAVCSHTRRTALWPTDRDPTMCRYGRGCCNLAAFPLH